LHAAAAPSARAIERAFINLLLPPVLPPTGPAPSLSGSSLAQCVGIQGKEILMTVKIVPNEKGNPPGKLADAELHFSEGLLEGLKLIGFSVWERKSGSGRNVTFPARQYSVNGERRSFALLRPIADGMGQDRVRDVVLQAYAEYEATAAVTT
jgi:hypothetical protein